MLAAGTLPRMSTQLHTQRARCPSFSPCGGVLVADGKPAAHVNTIDTQPTRLGTGDGLSEAGHSIKNGFRLEPANPHAC